MIRKKEDMMPMMMKRYFSIIIIIIRLKRKENENFDSLNLCGEGEEIGRKIKKTSKFAV